MFYFIWVFGRAIFAKKLMNVFFSLKNGEELG